MTVSAEPATLLYRFLVLRQRREMGLRRFRCTQARRASEGRTEIWDSPSLALRACRDSPSLGALGLWNSPSLASFRETSCRTRHLRRGDNDDRFRMHRADHLAEVSTAEPAVDARVDRRLDELHRTVAHEEVDPRGVGTEEVVGLPEEPGIRPPAVSARASGWTVRLLGGRGHAGRAGRDPEDPSVDRAGPRGLRQETAPLPDQDRLARPSVTWRMPTA